MLSRQAEGREWSGGDRSGVEGTGVEWSGGEGRGGEGRGGQGMVPDCLGGLSRVGISSRSTRPWNGQPPSIILNVVYRLRGEIILRYSQILPFRMSVDKLQIYTCQTLG